MILVLAVDDNGGLAFNKRRQTRDRAQRDHLRKYLKGAPLFMTAYSAKLYQADKPAEGLPEDCLAVCEDPLEKEAEGEFVLAELKDPSPYLAKTEKILLYRWNRTYPDDVVFPLDALKDFRLTASEEFAGSSHDNITFEVYER